MAPYSYVDQLNKILDVLGTPEERVITRIGSDKAQAYIRSLPIRKKAPFQRILPMADAQAIDLIAKMLTFDPAPRISVPDALEHPWLAAYHDEADEPSCPSVFDKWRQIEALETLDDFRNELWREIEEYRREVRGMELSGLPPQKGAANAAAVEFPGSEPKEEQVEEAKEVPTIKAEEPVVSGPGELPSTSTQPEPEPAPSIPPDAPAPDPAPGPAPQAGASDLDSFTLHSSTKPDPRKDEILRPSTPSDPVVSYARRSSILQPQRNSSYTSSPTVHHHQAHLSRQSSYFSDSPLHDEPGPLPQQTQNQIAFPSHPAYVVPARTRTASMAGDTLPRRLLRTLSTVSIHESAEGRKGGLAEIAPIGKWILEKTSATGMSDAEGLEEVSSTTDEPEEEEAQKEKDGKQRKFHVQ